MSHNVPRIYDVGKERSQCGEAQAEGAALYSLLSEATLKNQRSYLFYFLINIYN